MSYHALQEHCSDPTRDKEAFIRSQQDELDAALSVATQFSGDLI
jgi:hypothetical protein